jgi:hypothetical protein
VIEAGGGRRHPKTRRRIEEFMKAARADSPQFPARQQRIMAGLFRTFVINIPNIKLFN